MTDNEDKLINSFFQENVKAISDDGFTDKVMRSLPDSKAWWANKVWTFICAVAAIALFIVKDGLNILSISLGGIFREIAQGFQLQHFNITWVVLIGIVIIYGGVSLWTAFLKSEEL
jgi:hypothetical protein